MESQESNLGNQHQEKTTSNFSSQLVAFFNFPLIVLLVGSFIGIIGLFTWQRVDWVQKANLNRAEVIFDRQVNIIEKINADVGYYVADANTAIESIRKGQPQQRNTYIEKYNQRQAKWFAVSTSDQTLLLFYFPESENTPQEEKLSVKFEEIIEATWDVDIKLQLYSRNRTDSNYQAARKATDFVVEKLNNFNLLCHKKMKTRESWRTTFFREMK
ncbi:MAG: hypothetical protein QNJ70_29765 [Xenococcaceae cyanobacterium MO_207.B15]|nr:hypothetical protein [Xenococcaceae cyanobacterium MO_207.B15]MDJ0741886.1 hypothetical protein [Xenococcaceae cyanobacterium MO_167.B27]